MVRARARLLPPPHARAPEPIRDPARVAAEIGDASGRAGHAERLYRPRSEAELSAVMVEASRRGAAVTVAAGRTSTTGSSVPEGGWIVSTLGLSRILSIDVAARSARAETGVLLGDLQRSVRAAGLLHPPDPTSRDECSVGGAVACNASGPRSFLYGSTRSWVRSLRVVLASGEILALARGEVVAHSGQSFELVGGDGRSVVFAPPGYRAPDACKHAAGYASGPDLDLVDLFVGSEGTLGVVSEVEFDLLPAPEQVLALLAFFPDEAGALAAVRAAKSERCKEGGVRPRCLEWLDPASLDLVRERLPDFEIPVRAGWALFSEQECVHGEEAAVAGCWSQLLGACGALVDDPRGVLVALDAEARERFRRLRHAVPVGVNEMAARNGMPKLGSDLAVPDSAFGDMLELYRRAGEEPWSLLDGATRADLARQAGGERPSQLRRVVFGHAGDGHLHLNLLPETAAGLSLARAVQAQLAREAIARGGSPSAEHGIGKLKHAALREWVGDAGIEAMRAVKRALDPAGLLGRGNLFPA
jgi:D-lactate dehydrogenase (cytochrome)